MKSVTIITLFPETTSGSSSGFEDSSRHDPDHHVAPEPAAFHKNLGSGANTVIVAFTEVISDWTNLGQSNSLNQPVTHVASVSSQSQNQLRSNPPEDPTSHQHREMPDVRRALGTPKRRGSRDVTSHNVSGWEVRSPQKRPVRRLVGS